MLRFTSCQGDSTDAFCKDLAAFIGENLSIPSEYIGDIPWQEREQRLDRGEIHVGWICGLPYVRKKHDERLNFELLVAPVMKHPRYGAEPVYYSDVVVRADSSFRSFEDLRAGHGRTTNQRPILVTTSFVIISRSRAGEPISSAGLSNPVRTEAHFRCFWSARLMQPRSTARFWRRRSRMIHR